MLHPYPISIQNPIDGAYNTLSAMTNPTGKKRFEAGKNGSTIIAKLIIRIMEVCLLGVKMAVISNPNMVV